LADLAAYEGRSSDAIAILDKQIAANERDKRPDATAYAALAEALLDAGRTAEARKAAASALAASTRLEVRVPAARVLARVGDAEGARAVAAALKSELQPQKHAYGRIIDAEIALAAKQPRQALDALQDVDKSADYWLRR